jgi:hypothetical protein
VANEGMRQVVTNGSQNWDFKVFEDGPKLLSRVSGIYNFFSSSVYDLSFFDTFKMMIYKHN